LVRNYINIDKIVKDTGDDKFGVVLIHHPKKLAAKNQI
jgi:hypothetical protein